MHSTPENLRDSVCWELPHEPAAVGKARTMVAESLAAWRLTVIADDVVLATGELLSNAITHGRPPVRLSLHLGEAELCVHVTDHGPDLPRTVDADSDAVHGRGLAIVATLAHGWDVVPLTGSPGKTLRACWDLGRPAADHRFDDEPVSRR
ncbi:hypothetical protein Sru01_68790 [Sphaerisporangium rufum]|uniref:Histidine kinase/HSP90-like ATPase domain-containing protein n=2 Tax=Sphaerisporangium rufum TaxID=1381558 RepID=A0A919V4F4_9ACTN|nr:hypothetical protein Sru01_68790 [Sphaerisporangium rufum]